MTAHRGTPLSGVPLTALGVAMIRARESARADSLYHDPYAKLFTDAGREACHAPGAPAEAAQRWTQLEGLLDQFYEGRTVGVRVVDDRVRAWVRAGGRQLVMLGAGLDTRAYRMGLPTELRWFELDLPEMFEFKEPVLAATEAAPDCDRRVVPADLRTGWDDALRAAGHDPAVPTAWIDEGAIPYLAQDKAIAVAATITRLSAPGSEFDTIRAKVEETQRRYRDLRQLVTTDTETDRPVPRGLGPDAQDWLECHGWRTEFRSWDEDAAPHARPAAITGDPGNGSIHAVRRG